MLPSLLRDWYCYSSHRTAVSTAGYARNCFTLALHIHFPIRRPFVLGKTARTFVQSLGHDTVSHSNNLNGSQGYYARHGMYTLALCNPSRLSAMLYMPRRTAIQHPTPPCPSQS